MTDKTPQPDDLAMAVALDENKPLVRELRCDHYEVGYNSGYQAGLRMADRRTEAVLERLRDTSAYFDNIVWRDAIEDELLALRSKEEK